MATKTAADAADATKPAAVTDPEAQVTGSQFTPAPHVAVQEFVPLVRQTDPVPVSLPPKKFSESLSLSRLFCKVRDAIVNHVSPATSGTEAFDVDRKKYEFEETMYEDAGPWHEYHKLDSDSDTLNTRSQGAAATNAGRSAKPSKTSKKERIKSWIGLKESKDAAARNSFLKAKDAPNDTEPSLPG